MSASGPRGGRPALGAMEAAAATGLPIVPRLGEICGALERHGSLALRADTGSGKSTLAPLAILERLGGRVVVLEPRRAAAMGIASRIAELLGESVGGTAGYSVRLDKRVSRRTRIEVVTEGLFARRLQESPSMLDSGSGGEGWTVIFDEFHERSAFADLALAFVLDLRRMGCPARVATMSATMDARKAALALGGGCDGGAGCDAAAPIIECPGRAFPVETSYLPLPGRGPLGRECAEALAGILDRERGRGRVEPGGVLVFLPGAGEIADCAGLLEARGFGADFDIEALHGSLPLERQRRALAPPREGRRRVILSTNVAETGLTIPGVELVVDSGHARSQRLHAPSGLNRLSLGRISEGSARQRAGRAGRLGPGRCVRLWARGDSLPESDAPEIARADISGAVLESLIWGAPGPGDLPWPDRPGDSAWAAALALLSDLGAAEPGPGGRHAPTETGRRMAALGLEPRLARLCVAGRDSGLAAVACAAAALLSGRDRAAHGGGAQGAGGPDFAARLAAMRRDPKSRWAAEALGNAGDLMRRLGESGPALWGAGDEAALGPLAAAAFPDRIAIRRGPYEGPEGGAGHGQAVFRFPSGREARCAMPLAASEWICALEADSGERLGAVRLAVPLSREGALEALAGKAAAEKSVEWDGLSPRLAEICRAGRIALWERRRPCMRSELAPFLAPMLIERGIGALPWDGMRGAPRRLLERIRFFASRVGAGKGCGHGGAGGNPAEMARSETAGAGGLAGEGFAASVAGSDSAARWGDAALAAEAWEWLGPFVWGGGERAGRPGEPVICAEGLCSALRARLGWEEARRMDALAPESLGLPSGRRVRIEYGSGEPEASLRIQEAFGMAGPFEVMGCPVLFRLLSPAGRPAQSTRDLDGFWSGSYREVRRELRGRYPKHDWPENPARR